MPKPACPCVFEIVNLHAQAHALPDYKLLRRILRAAPQEVAPAQRASCPSALQLARSVPSGKRPAASPAAYAAGHDPRVAKRHRPASPTCAADSAHWLQAEE